MKIQSISSTKFGGIYIDKSAENGGNWKVQYRPYSWENKNKSTMAEPKEYDFYSHTLPDNEKISYSCGKTEILKDIFNTRFFYADKENDVVRRRIEQLPSMNREESLNTKLRKLRLHQSKQGWELDRLYNILTGDSMAYPTERSYDFTRARNNYYETSRFSKHKDSHVESMNNCKNDIMNSFERFAEDAKHYAQLIKAKAKGAEDFAYYSKEAEKLKNLRENGLLIDISRRDIYDPNKAIWDAMQDVKTAIKKSVAFPDSTMSIQELFRRAEITLNDRDIAKKVINFVDDYVRRMHISI